MSNNSVKITIFNPTATVNRICNNDSVGIFLATTWSRYFAKYTPMQSGVLRENISINPFEVVYNSPYAHYQWEGKLYVSPTTGSSWAQEGETKVPTDIDLSYNTEQNPLATSHWEVPAYEAFKDDVARQVTEYIRRL